MQRYLESLRADGDRFAEVMTTHPLDLPVPSCPGWTLQDLAAHMGFIHRWARLAAETVAPPDPATIDPAPVGDAEALGAWLLLGRDRLIDTLSGLAPDAPTWHPFTVAKVAGVWHRRQANGLAIHRWDAEAAAGDVRPFDPSFAADFVGEYFEVIVPRVRGRDGKQPPLGTLEVVITDTGTVLQMTVDESSSSVVDVTALASGADRPAADAVLAAPAGELILALWGRAALADAPADGLAAEWLTFGGN